MRKLNLGCGNFKKRGFVNVDWDISVQPDLAANLESFPYPFHDNTFDLIEADHVLEHLTEPFRVMKELHRITKPGGVVHIRVPHFSRAMTHPQHKRGFDVTFPYYFDETFQGGFTGVRFFCKKRRLHWFSQKRLMKTVLHPVVYHLLSVTGMVLDMLANLSPFFCSRIWCFWVGGFSEVAFIFVKI